MSEIKEENRKLQELAFVPEQTKKIISFDDAIKESKNYIVSDMIVPASDIQFSYNGKAAFNIKGHAYPTTAWGVTTLCKHLQIPDPFANLIPLDLLKHNINRLTKDCRKFLNVKLNLNNDIVGITGEKYRPLHIQDLLPRLAEKVKSPNNVQIILNTGNTVVTFTNPNIKKLEPQVGDITECGTEIINSELEGFSTRANIFLYRLICSNGATLTENWGRVTQNKNNKIQYDTVLNQFVDGCQKLTTNQEKLAEVYNKLPDTSLNSRQFVSLWKPLNVLVGKEVATKILLTTLEEVKDISTYEQRRTRFSPLLNIGNELPRDTKKNAYEVFNNITSTARDTGSICTAKKIRTVSGHLLWSIIDPSFSN